MCLSHYDVGEKFVEFYLDFRSQILMNGQHRLTVF